MKTQNTPVIKKLPAGIRGYPQVAKNTNKGPFWTIMAPIKTKR